jgi:hypothetical protein
MKAHRIRTQILGVSTTVFQYALIWAGIYSVEFETLTKEDVTNSEFF